MAGNPRKFSEKIALHTQKQAEETAAFEQIMKEVNQIGTRTTPQPVKSKQQNLMPINSSQNCRSLPNVHQMSLPGEQAHRGHFGQRTPSPRASRNSIGPVKTPRSRTDHSPYAVSPPVAQSILSNSINVGNSSSNISVMYPTNYLSPPVDAQWRRAASDSALNSLSTPKVVPDSSEESSNNSNDPRDIYAITTMYPTSNHNETPTVIPNVTGEATGLLDIPASASTGSLPDLTNFQFTPPLQQPLDTEDSQLTNSPYSTSPLSATYSPTGGSPNPPTNPNQSHQNNNQRSSHPQQIHHLPQTQIPISQTNQAQLANVDNTVNTNVNQTFQQNYTTNDNMLMAYRCPQRPSPQNSPSPFRSPSPNDGQLSAPTSPAAPQLQTSADSMYFSQQANALQQHFEQISMDGSSSPQRNNSQWQGGGILGNSPYFYNTGQAQIQPGATAAVTQQSPQPVQPQTPQTPTSIPDIIFTDFSEVRSTEPLEDFLATEAAAQVLREGLGTLDMDGFNMLADPDLVPLDPQAEDSFRLDRLD